MTDQTIIKTHITGGIDSESVTSRAIFSPCEKYRYVLQRTWNDKQGKLAVIGLNPSTATETTDDRTIAKMIRLAKRLEFGGLVMLNLFAWRATQRRNMKLATNPVGPMNDHFLVEYCRRAAIVLCAWGTDGGHNKRDRLVMQLLADELPINSFLYYLKLTAGGFPQHPLYLKDTLDPQPWLDFADYRKA